MRSLRRGYLSAQAQIGSCFSRNRSDRLRPDWYTKFFLPVSSSAFQCLLNATNHSLAHAFGIAKAYFAFRRMNIYIHSAGIELNKKECNRILPLHKSGVVTFADGSANKTAFDRSPIYEYELLAAGLPAETCLTNKTTDLNLWSGSAVHFDKALQQFDPV